MNMIWLAVVVAGPAGMANFAPLFANQIRALDRLTIPIDGGKKFRGQRIFGDNKTLKGFVAGFFLALLGVWVQRRMLGFNNPNYSNELLTFHPLLLAFLYDIGALGGDALESFFKRQFKRPPGSTWFPFDQTDFVVGMLLVTWWLVHYSAPLTLSILLVMPALHLISSVIGYVLHLKARPI